jgi:hypothetical protein
VQDKRPHPTPYIKKTEGSYKGGAIQDQAMLVKKKDQAMYYLNNTEKDRRLITLFLALKLVTNVTIDFNAAPPTLHK